MKTSFANFSSVLLIGPYTGDGAVLVRSHMNGLQPFESAIEQTTETMPPPPPPPSHKTITTAAMTTNSLRELLHYRGRALILYTCRVERGTVRVLCPRTQHSNPGQGSNPKRTMLHIMHGAINTRELTTTTTASRTPLNRVFKVSIRPKCCFRFSLSL